MALSLTKSPLEYKKVQHFISRFVRGNRLGMRKDRITGKEYLDVGCEYIVHDNFINLDYMWHPKLDMCWDVTNKMPLPDASLKGIYTEHCLEHITIYQMDDVLKDFYRLLKPGGTVRIIVPSGTVYLNAYIDRHMKGSDTPFPYEFQDPVEEGFYTPMMSLNRIMRKWGHQFIYDYETLELMLRKNGFIDIKQEEYRVGRDPVLLMDTDWRADESLIAEASKPL